MLTPKERIHKLLDYYDINANKFAAAVGLNPQNIYEISYGKTKTITLNVADKIKAVYPYVSMAWLLTGRGEMMDPVAYDDAPSELSGTSPEGSERADVEKAEEMDSGTLKGCRIFSNIFCSSMRPVIDVGDQLLVSRWVEDFVIWGKIYLLTTKKGNSMIGYLFPSERQGFYLCRSADPEKHPDVEFPCEEVKELYLVRGQLNIF